MNRLVLAAYLLLLLVVVMGGLIYFELQSG